MFAKVKVIDSQSEYVNGRFDQVVDFKKVNEVILNTSFIISITVLKVDKKTIWEVKFTNSNTRYTLPFKY